MKGYVQVSFVSLLKVVLLLVHLACNTANSHQRQPNGAIKPPRLRRAASIQETSKSLHTEEDIWHWQEYITQECSCALVLAPNTVDDQSCPTSAAALLSHRSNPDCKTAQKTFCYKRNCSRCCIFSNSCNPHPGILVTRRKCKEFLCASIKCKYPGEVCILSHANQPRCRCRKSCPTAQNWYSVCGTDNLTYQNECHLNRTACILGQNLTVKHNGPCIRSSKRLYVSSLHQTTTTLTANKPGQITCEYNGKPISITWSKIELDSLPPQMIPKRNVLVIPMVRVSDEGVYMCEAYDGYTVVETFVNVTVTFDGDGIGADAKRKSRTACMLPRRRGYCRQYDVRWYFDATTRICLSFVYSGCGQNENNFKSESDCKKACGHWVGDVCKLPKLSGPCNAHIPRWYYNTKTKRCERFVYGGCRGNVNRFSSHRSCEVKCKAQSNDVTPCIRQYENAINSQRLGLFIPWCTGDGKYEKQQCHGSVCFCVGETGIEEPGTRVQRGQMTNCTAKLAHKGPTPCEAKRREAKGRPFSEGHVPQCKQDGTHEEVQCSPWTGACWCVDSNGTEMAGTKTRKSLRCPSIGARLTKCQRQYIENSKSRRAGRFIPHCADDGSYRQVQCRGLSCSCVNRETGQVIAGTNINIDFGYPQCETAGGITTCQRLHQEAIKNPDRSRFVPQCKNNGDFEEVQCNSSTKECWCVDRKGREVLGTKVQGTITCPIQGSSLTLCQRRHQHALKRRYSSMNQRAPRCKPDGSYEDIQCHGRQCHCVNHYGVQIPGTRIHSLARTPNCTHPDANITPCEKVQRSAIRSSSGKFVPRCKPDGSWEDIQCEHTTGECWCVDSNGMEVEQSRTTGDVSCKQNGPQYSCWVKYVRTLRSLRKVGHLPWCKKSGSFNTMQCYGSFCYCVHEDGTEISGTRISVFVGRPECGNGGRGLSRCQRQYRGSVLSSWMGGHVTRCKLDGRYEEVQCDGGASECWCVNERGNELPGTRKMTPIKCPVIGGSLTSCKRKYLDYARNPFIGRIVPRCKPDGSFEPVQCRGLFCFCVDENGMEIRGTRLSNRIGKPTCKEDQYLSPCQKETMRSRLQPDTINRYVARCKPDGSYDDVQCHRGRGECWCVDKHGAEMLGTRNTGFIKCPSAVPSPTPCQKEYQDILRGSLMPEFVPQCTPEGQYERIQCRGSICYCVNAFGVEIYGSRVTQRKEKPRCRSVGRGPTLCHRQLHTFSRNGERRALEPSCNSDGSYRDIQCHGAQCYCVNKRGVEIAGTRRSFLKGRPNCEKERFALTPCQQQIQDVILSPSSSHQFVPQCKENGQYEEIQCDVITGFCWCVDVQGREITNSKTNGPINCGAAVTRSACWRDFLRASNTSLPGAFVPWCTAAGTYHSTQLQGSRYFCVNRGGREIQGTVISVTVGKPNCKAAVSPSFIPSLCQRQQANQMYSPLTLSCYITACKTSGSYDAIQCEATFGQCWCVDKRGKELNGVRTAGLIICPPNAPLTRCQQLRQTAFQAIATKSSIPHFIPRCRPDGGFADVQCHGLSGQCWCVDINGNERPGSVSRGHNPDCAEAEKLSACHRHRLVALGITGRPNPGRYLPQCQHDGRYEEVQCHSRTGLCWCVDERGQEITGTRKWGHPRCHVIPSGNGFPLDFAIMLPPSSTSQTQEAMRNFARSIVSSFDVSPRATRFSLIVFADKLLAPLTFSSLKGESLSTANIDEIITSMSIDGGITRLDRGLLYANQEVFMESKGMRGNAEKVIVVVVDKKQTRDQGRYTPLTIATLGLKEKGVTIYCIGIGDKIDVSELMQVSSGAEDVYTVDDYDALGSDGLEITDVIKNKTRYLHGGELQCNQAVEPGKLGCLASIPAWYYDSTSGQCLQFTYSGCGGNSNNFPTHQTCRRKCGGIFPLCHEERRRRSRLALGHYTPACSESGQYNTIQCYGSTGNCWCVDRAGVERPGTRVDGIPVCNFVEDKLTPCLKERRKALGFSGVPSIGRHVPDCKPDGEYNEVQSLGNSEYRWCVDRSGYTLAATQRWGKVQCTRQREECPVTTHLRRCPQEMTGQTCSSDKDCAIGFKCCSCKENLRCTKMNKEREDLSECEGERARSISGWSDIGPAKFVPKCTSDGSYEEIQCYGKICWCVDSEGNEKPGTRQRGKPLCKEIESLSPCQKQYRRSSAIRSRTPLGYFLPRCKPNGAYNPVQCHTATGFCWCVDSTGDELAGTRRWGKPKCVAVKGKPTVCQVRRKECQRKRLPSKFMPRCMKGGSYEAVQCLKRTRECWCVDRYGYELPGTRSHHKSNCSLLAWLSLCQIQRRLALGIVGIPVVGRFFPECKADGSYASVQCDRRSRACWCVNQQGGEIEGSRRTPGVRPNCDRHTLCKEIRQEILNSSKRMLSSAPECLPDGRFSPVQCMSDMGLCWCVDEYGNIVSGTMSKRKDIKCNGVGLSICHTRYNAAIHSQGLALLVPLCNTDGSYASMQCDNVTEECWCAERDGREAPNTRRQGNAQCVSEDEQKACKLPFTGGPCRAFLPRWYFNGTRGICDVFLYGGCGGNENRYTTYQQCQARCRGKSLTPCQQSYEQAKFNLGRYTPVCRGDGSYAHVQCLHGDQECWCVDSSGVEIQGTRTIMGIKPDCGIEGKESGVSGRL